MIDNALIHTPPHYLEGRKIQPIDVIESLNLNHHLACVVKYIARAGRKNPILEDLKKGEWYLNRLLSKENIDSLAQRNSFGWQSEDLFLDYSSQDVCEDWQLSDCLCSAIINIYISVECQSRLLKEKALSAALDCLREEIIIHEQIQAIELSENKDHKSKFKDTEAQQFVADSKKSNAVPFPN
jgi:hypothetical protein